MSNQGEDPATYEVVWLLRAQRSLIAIVISIAQDGPAAALSVKERIDRAAAHLASYPAIGRQGRIDGTRELVMAELPYIIPYRVRRGRVEVLDVIHAARRWPSRI